MTAGGHDPRADAGQRLAARDPVRQGPESGRGSTGRAACSAATRRRRRPASRRSCRRSQFEPFIAAMLSRAAFGPIDDTEAARSSTRSTAGRARVALALDAGRRERSAHPAAGFRAPHSRPVRRLSDHRRDADPDRSAPDQDAVRAEDARSGASRSRATRRWPACARPARAPSNTRSKRRSKPCIARRGAVSRAYPSIVGSGPNATILHYPEDDRQMQAGDLLLVDAACNYDYMSGDITRTYPVSGTFSRAPEGHLRDRAAGAGGGDEGGAGRHAAAAMSTTRRSR